MTSVEAVDPVEAPEAGTPRRRHGRWVPIVVVVALVVGIGGWLGAAHIGRVETGSATMAEAGLVLPDCVPHDDYWTSFDETEDVVVAHTVHNPSPWPVTVISPDPEVYRFQPVGDDLALDTQFAAGPSDDFPAGTQSSVVLPPDRSVAMWIVNPQGNVIQNSLVRYTFDGVPLKVRSLGVEREVFMPYRGLLYVGGGSQSSEELSAALEEACKG